MWKVDNRSCYNRDSLLYPSDLTDAEWSDCLSQFVIGHGQ
jgi:hypothetical protein